MAEQPQRTVPARSVGAGLLRSMSPLGLLALCLIASAVVAVLLVTGHPRVGGVVAVVGGTALLAGTAGARESGRTRERLGELVLDRVFDASILAPVAWAARHGSARTAALALFALGASFVASYERARGEALGYRGSEGFGYRATRVALLVLGLLTGWVEAALWLFLLVTVGAAVVRAWNVSRQEIPAGDRAARPRTAR
jgi:phosphatidylglycerophosphate synthase